MRSWNEELHETGTEERPKKRITRPHVTAFVVAEKIIEFCNQHGEWLTNLRLQKLLYYSQAWHLALYDKPLFSEDFEAGLHGPVQPEVFTKYHKTKNEQIVQNESSFVFPQWLDGHTRDVMEAYGRFSAFDLERLSCHEEPWTTAREGVEANTISGPVISHASMKRYFKLKLSDE